MWRRNHSLRRLLRQPIFRIVVALIFIWDNLHILSIYSAQGPNRHAPTPPPSTRRIYIASQHWNNAQLLRDRWNDALITLVKELGVENVYVTVYESGSYDDTKGALRELDAQLGELKVGRKIMLSDVSHQDEMEKQPEGKGWVKTPTGEMALRRIPFLANLRNRVLDKLVSLSSEGQKFDTVLFLNDVVFKPEDVLALLNTNNGNYAAACSLDFSHPPDFYDTFALRDSSGHEALTQTWPYFRSYHSRYAAERFLPVPVASCWNGMVAMPAAPFLAQNPLRFRGISDSLGAYHLEGSECCLIHADNYHSAKQGVFLNPNVLVGYSGAAYDDIQRRYDDISLRAVYSGIWKNRLLRWTTTTWFKERMVHNRVTQWKNKHRTEDENGEVCLINEMQIMRENGWGHV